MKFEFNLGSMSIKQEANNWTEKVGDTYHNYHDPAKEFNMSDVKLSVEFSMEEIIQMCKSQDLTVVEGLKLLKELGPQFMDMLSKKYERKNNAEREIAELKNQLDAARSCKEYIRNEYNKLVKEVEDRPTRLAE